jgi:hypothetical protein
MYFKKKSYMYIFPIILCLGLISFLYVKSVKSDKSVSIPKYTLDKIVKENIQPISLKPSFGGKIFCDYKIISSEKNNNKIELYLWILAQEYYINNNKLVKGTGGQFPAVLIIKKENNKYKFISCNISRAEETDESINIFPKSIRNKALQLSKIDTDSIKNIQKDAENYFKAEIK